MALHLITGYKGEAHISAEDVGAFNAGVIGKGEYVLPIGEQFKAELPSNNTVKIYDGDLIMQGRHVSLRSGTLEEITINNGETGKNRNDIIVARYTKNIETGVENVSFVVVQGESVEGTAVDPGLQVGDILSGNCLIHDMPLYRVKLSGLTASKPEKLFRTIGSSENGLLFRGWNPLKSKSEDTPKKWMELGSGFWMIDLDEQLIGQPNQWGILYNTVCSSSEVAQKFVIQTTGETYRRNANTIGWYGTNWREGTWIPMYDQTNFPIQVADYWGNGNYGEAKPNSLTFNFEPKFVVISGSDSNYPQLLAVNGQPYVMTAGTANSGVSLNWNGKTLSWYSSESAINQLNYNGTHYFVFAIG